MKSFAKKGTTLVFNVPQRGFAATVTIKMPKFELHKLDDSMMPKTATSNKEELMAYFTRMSLMRRTEIVADNLYKAK